MLIKGLIEYFQDYLDSGMDEYDEACYLNKEEVEVIVRALEQTRWIPVSERLPDTDGIFLTYIVNPYDTKLSYVMICDYICQKWIPFDDAASSNVVAWMPLPEPYIESEDSNDT